MKTVNYLDGERIIGKFLEHYEEGFDTQYPAFIFRGDERNELKAFMLRFIANKLSCPIHPKTKLICPACKPRITRSRKSAAKIAANRPDPRDTRSWGA